MRRAVIGLVLGLLVLGISAVPAGASQPPSALALAKKLTKAGLCHAPHVTNPAETKAACVDDTGLGSAAGIQVSAFRTKKAMQADLTADLTTTCGFLPDNGFGQQVNYRVGATWWTAPYADALSRRIAKALGGTIKKYDCP